jgi:hypothetical protein
MRHKQGSNTCLSLAEISCDRIRLILKSSVITLIDRLFTIYYLEILTNEVFVWEDEISPSNAVLGMVRRQPRSPRMAHAAMRPVAEQNPAVDSAKRQDCPDKPRSICATASAEN